MDKQYETIPSNIGQYPKAIYELYFNSVLIRKVVNGSRDESEVIKEILNSRPMPDGTRYAKITKNQNGIITTPWYYEKEKRRIYDIFTDEIYESALIAHQHTGVLRATIISQCVNILMKKRRFRFAVNGD